MRELQQIVGHSLETIVDWTAQCRQVCSLALKVLPKLSGTYGKPFQIDESYFSGRRKYGRGRLLQGDRSNTYSNDGKRTNGPWVVGFYIDDSNVRFAEVPNRNGETLMQIIKKFVADGSVVVTDQWAGYNRLNDNDYHHFTVNHSANYVDPITGYHTNGIERMWSDVKARTKSERRCSHHLQLPLDEVSSRKRVNNS